jgi:hypothetical protein
MAVTIVPPANTDYLSLLPALPAPTVKAPVPPVVAFNPYPPYPLPITSGGQVSYPISS